MTIPSRLANDGWWLCADLPPLRAATNRDEKEFQMTDVSTSAAPVPAFFNTTSRRLILAAILAAVADWLFYGHGLGVSLALFLMLVAALSLSTNPLAVDRRQALLGVALLVAGLLPIVESLNPLSVLIAVVTTSVVVASLTNPFIDDLSDRVKSVLLLLFSGPVRLLDDVRLLLVSRLSFKSFAVWTMPVMLTGVFLLLFALANPLIAKWLAALNPGTAASRLDVPRLLLWLAVAGVSWPFVAISWKRRPPAVLPAQQAAAESEPAEKFPIDIFHPAAIVRALLLFNLLFAVQTVLDVTYLWGGVALPDGMTYASYAHRGAYPLIVTALLAAGFVLVATNPGGAAERVPLIRVLVFAWIAQNVLLVLSSILRLDLYVEIYSLTWWRVAAFIWMVLVALGLLLIVARIATGRSNRWLILANCTTLGLVAYTCAFINFSALIADYNVAHSSQISGRGAWLDFAYLADLGPQALPAIDRYLQHARQDPRQDKPTLAAMEARRGQLAQTQRGALSTWREWGFRDWRLERYLDGSSVNPASSSGVE
jgi:hypothetical protein